MTVQRFAGRLLLSPTRTSSGSRFSVALTHHTCHKNRDPPAGACALTGGSLAGERHPLWVRHHRSLRLPCVSNDQGGALPLGERPRFRGIACATHRSGPATSRPVLPLELCQGGLPLGVPGEGIRSRCTVRERRGSIRLHHPPKHQTPSDSVSDVPEQRDAEDCYRFAEVRPTPQKCAPHVRPLETTRP